MKKPTQAQETAFAGSLNESQLLCRTFSHHWIVQQITKESKYFVMVLACQCGARRIDTLNSKGDVVSRNLDYSGAPGYLSKIGRPTRGKALFRKETITRYTKGG